VTPRFGTEEPSAPVSEKRFEVLNFEAADPEDGSAAQSGIKLYGVKSRRVSAFQVPCHASTGGSKTPPA
jgi:hypothetical protein